MQNGMGFPMPFLFARDWAIKQGSGYVVTKRRLANAEPLLASER